MRRVLLRWVPHALLATVVAGAVALFAPVDRALVLQIYLLVVGALVLVTLVAAAGALRPRVPESEFDRALRRPRRDRIVPERLTQLERHVSLASDSAFDLHFRLRPTIAAVGAARLWRRHGIELEREPERARRRLPGEVWELARPDAEPPADVNADGPSLRELDRLVSSLENI